MDKEEKDYPFLLIILAFLIHSIFAYLLLSILAFLLLSISVS